MKGLFLNFADSIYQNMEQAIEELARKNQREAWKIIQDTDIVNLWRSIGAEVNLVGSLRMGLLMKHRDIDFHLYTSQINLSDDFRVMARLAENPSVKRIEYGNSLDMEERCVEWHAWIQEEGQEPWQIDMIHIVKGSRYDGYFERMAERISATLTEETRRAILRLKYETPDIEKIMGIEYYRAVLEGHVHTYAELERWRENHPVAGVVEWFP